MKRFTAEQCCFCLTLPHHASYLTNVQLKWCRLSLLQNSSPTEQNREFALFRVQKQSIVMH